MNPKQHLFWWRHLLKNEISQTVNECSNFRGRCSDRRRRGGLLYPLRLGDGGAMGQNSLQELRSLSHNPFCSLSLSKTVQSEPLGERLRENRLERLTWWLVNRLNCIMCCKKAHLIRQLFKASCLTISKGNHWNVTDVLCYLSSQLAIVSFKLRVQISSICRTLYIKAHGCFVDPPECNLTSRCCATDVLVFYLKKKKIKKTI